MAQNLVLNILAHDKTKQALSGVQSSLGRLRASIFSIQSALLGIGAGVLTRSFINVGREVEELGVRFNFLFGSVQEGQKAFKELVAFAGKVPFTLQEIAVASGNLAVISKDANELAKNLKIVGNVSAVTGLDFRTTAEQIQRSFAGGISAADIFRERGVRALLGFKAGATISIEDTVKRFEEVFGEGGRFGRATEVLATTFTGTLSMIQDKIFQFKLGVNEAGFFDFIKGGLATINDLLEENEMALKDFANTIGKNLVDFIKSALIGFGEVFNTVKGVFKIIGTGIAGTIDLVKALPEGVREFGILGFLLLGRKGKLAVIILGGLIKKLGIDIEEMSKRLGLNTDEANEFGKELSTVEKFINRIEESIISNTKELAKMNDEIAKAKAEAEATVTPFIEMADKIKGSINKSLKETSDLANNVTKVLQLGIDGFSKGIAESIVLGKELNTTMKDLGRTLAVEVLSTLIKIVAQKAVMYSIDRATAMIQSKTGGKGFFSSITSLFGGGGSGLFQSGLGFARASGGTVSKGQPYLVGEKGAELFIPNSTGQIAQSARGMGGGAVSVNFNINTLDARGFDELLVRNRGTITQIINSAVNERGAKSLI
jgi:hypothetical protein